MFAYTINTRGQNLISFVVYIELYNATLRFPMFSFTSTSLLQLNSMFTYKFVFIFDCRNAEGNLYTKVAELQEDISSKRYDLGVAQLSLAAVHGQV